MSCLPTKNTTIKEYVFFVALSSLPHDSCNFCTLLVPRRTYAVTRGSISVKARALSAADNLSPRLISLRRSAWFVGDHLLFFSIC